MKNGNDGQNAPEKVGYTRYYEHDGMLRAYANRSMVLAMVFGVIALSSFAFAVYVRLQPPTVIRVDSEGEAAIVGGTPAHKIQDDQIITNFTVRTISVVQGSPLTFTAFGVKEIHRLKNKQETTDQIVGRYNVRLALDRRTEYNPSGLLVADYWEQQMVGDKNTGLSQADELSHEATRKKD